jgi:hypothetical protein
MGKMDFSHGVGTAHSDTMDLTLSNIRHESHQGREYYTATDQHGRVWDWSYTPSKYGPDHGGSEPGYLDKDHIPDHGWSISYQDKDGTTHNWHEGQPGHPVPHYPWWDGGDGKWYDTWTDEAGQQHDRQISGPLEPEPSMVKEAYDVTPGTLEPEPSMVKEAPPDVIRLGPDPSPMVKERPSDDLDLTAGPPPSGFGGHFEVPEEEEQNIPPLDQYPPGKPPMGTDVKEDEQNIPPVVDQSPPPELPVFPPGEEQIPPVVDQSPPAGPPMGTYIPQEEDRYNIPQEEEQNIPPLEQSPSAEPPVLPTSQPPPPPSGGAGGSEAEEIKAKQRADEWERYEESQGPQTPSAPSLEELGIRERPPEHVSIPDLLEEPAPSWPPVPAPEPLVGPTSLEEVMGHGGLQDPNLTHGPSHSHEEPDQDVSPDLG